jgi:hypothetical protein
MLITAAVTISVLLKEASLISGTQETACKM